MKITIDLDKLLSEGQINQDEYEKFARLSAQFTSLRSYNVLVGFGVIAVSGAALAIVPTPATAIIIGLLVGALGGWLLHQSLQWQVLGNMCLLVGALLLGGGLMVIDEGSNRSVLAVSLMYALVAILGRSSLLIVLSVLLLSAYLGALAGYGFATYTLVVDKPALTALVFSFFSIGTYQLSRYLKPDYEALSLAAARTGVLLVNLALWVGSLWGDKLGKEDIILPDWAFGLLWAVLLIAAGVWAWRNNRRWLVNTVATFGGIHFYTQWFERLGDSPWSVLFAGLIALGIALGLKTVNLELREREKSGQ